MLVKDYIDFLKKLSPKTKLFFRIAGTDTIVKPTISYTTIKKETFAVLEMSTQGKTIGDNK